MTNLIEKEKVIEYLLEEGEKLKKEHRSKPMRPTPADYVDVHVKYSCWQDWCATCNHLNKTLIDSFDKFFKENHLGMQSVNDVEEYYNEDDNNEPKHVQVCQ